MVVGLKATVIDMNDVQLVQDLGLFDGQPKTVKHSPTLCRIILVGMILITAASALIGAACLSLPIALLVGTSSVVGIITIIASSLLGAGLGVSIFYDKFWKGVLFGHQS